MDIEAIISELNSSDPLVRETAADKLSDVIEGNNSIANSTLQTIVLGLGAALETESNPGVVESILNAISNAKNNPKLVLPVAIINKQLSSYENSALEHALYILRET